MRRWRSLAARAGRNDLPGILARAALLDDNVFPDDMPRAVEDAWTSAEWPLSCLDAELWTMLFYRALDDDDALYLHEAERRPKDELPETIRLWRGALPGNVAGMSWTDDRDRAEWFAYRFGKTDEGPRVFEYDAPRSAVLARYHESRGENEYVLDTEYLDPDDAREVA